MISTWGLSKLSAPDYIEVLLRGKDIKEHLVESSPMNGHANGSDEFGAIEAACKFFADSAKFEQVSPIVNGQDSDFRLQLGEEEKKELVTHLNEVLAISRLIFIFEDEFEAHQQDLAIKNLASVLHHRSENCLRAL